MEKENDGSKHAIDQGEDAVEIQVLLKLGQGAQDEGDKDQGQDEEQGALHDLGRGPLVLVLLLQLFVLRGSGCLHDGKGDNDQDDDGHVDAVHETGIQTQEAMVLAAKAVILKAHAEEDNDKGTSPTHDDVLHPTQKSILENRERESLA